MALLFPCIPSDFSILRVVMRESRERTCEGAPRGFATRSSVLARLALLAQIGELARMLEVVLTVSSLEPISV